MRGRYLKENKSTRTPGIMLALAVRSMEDDMPGKRGRSLAFVSACAAAWHQGPRGPSRQRQVDAARPDDLRDWIAGQLDRRKAAWLWCAGLGQAMSLCGFWDWLDSGRFSLLSPTQQRRREADIYQEEEERSRGFLCLGDPPLIVSGWLDGKRLLMLDVRNWWQNYNDDGMPTAARLTTLVQRVKDTAALVRGLDIGVMKPTVASQAIGHWRHQKGRPAVLIPDSRKESRLARAAYFGARADCFWIGPRQGPIVVVDCNSVYGSLMQRELLPTKLAYMVDKIGFDRGLFLCADGSCIAQVKVKTQSPLPVRWGVNGVSYAIGEFWTVLAGVELKCAAESGSITAIGKLARYELDHTCKAFADFWLYQREIWRNTGRPELEGLAKAMLCSLYGRWAAKKPGWTAIELPGEDRRWGSAQWRDWRSGLTHPVRIIAGRAEADLSRSLNVLPVHHPVPIHGLQVHARDVETESSFPAIAAFITAACRVHMDKARAAAGPDNVLYQCYDALHLTAEGYEKMAGAGLIHPTTPGLFKAGKPFSEVVYHGINCLRIDGKLQWAGLPSNFRELTEGRIEATLFERVESVLHRGPDGTVRLHDGNWKSPPNPWGAYATIGMWRTPQKIGGEV